MSQTLGNSFAFLGSVCSVPRWPPDPLTRWFTTPRFKSSTTNNNNNNYYYCYLCCCNIAMLDAHVITDGVLSYNMPQGDRRAPDVDLRDFTYDGVVTDLYLSGGLGQLTDGIEGHSNFRLDPDGWGRKGYEWVGWRNDSLMSASLSEDDVEADSVVIVFEFERARRFTGLRLHSNNMFSRDVRVFRRAVVRVGLAVDDVVPGAEATAAVEPVVYEHRRDNLIDFARNIAVALPSLVGRFVSVRLFFDAGWMLISEVRFESVLVPENKASSTTKSPSVISRIADHPHYNTSESDSGAALSSGIDSSQVNVDGLRPAVTASQSSTFVQQLVGCVFGGTLALLLLVVTAIVLCRQGRRGRRRAGASKASAAAGARSTSTFRLFGGHATTAMTRDDSATLTSTGKTTSNGVSSFSNCSISAVAGVTDDNDDDYDVTTLARCFRLPHDVIRTRQLPKPPPPPLPHSSSTYQPQYLTDDASSPYAAIGNGRVHYSATSAMPPTLLSAARQRRDVGVYKPDTLPAFYDCRDLLSSTPSYDHGPRTPAAPDDSSPAVELPRSNLRLIRSLGSGLFGDVHLCELIRDGDYDDAIGKDLLGTSQTTYVTFRTFNADLHLSAREAFRRQTAVMSRLKHCNVVALLGVCSFDEPPGVVLEYVGSDDLATFLRSNATPITDSTDDRHVRTNLSYGCLIFMATQIASAMKYIEVLGVVHGSLSASSCLVDQRFTVKLSDFGAAVHVYTAALAALDAGRCEVHALPVRWMAWESVVMGEFTSKSDVWSFAVTLWEILASALLRPFEPLSDDDVITNCRRCRDSTAASGSPSTPALLDQPVSCPREIYDLMLECWRVEASQRPTFREIHMFLQRKNSGYSPDDEPVHCRQTVSDV